MESSYIREQARFSLAGKWGVAILVTVIAALLGGLVTGSGGSVDVDAETIAKFPEGIRNIIIAWLGIVSVLGIVRFVLGGVVQLGYSKFLLNLQDHREVQASDLFSQFDRFGDGFCLALLRGLYTALWTLLFIIPGIVAAYGYSMANFIMLENPGMGANEALRASKEMMKGHKFELFCLELSFIGWDLLAVLTLGIGSLWVTPYKNAAHAAFYRELCGPRITVE